MNAELMNGVQPRQNPPIPPRSTIADLTRSMQRSRQGGNLRSEDLTQAAGAYARPIGRTGGASRERAVPPGGDTTMRILHQVRQRYERWRAETTYRRLFRQQLWQQRRQRLQSEVRRERDKFDRRSGRPVVLVASAVLLTGVAGYAAVRSAGGPGDGPPSTEGTAQPADHSPEEQRSGRGPGLARVGIHLSAAVDDVGNLEVVEQARAAEPILELSLAPPPAQAGSDATPRLEDVQLFVDGEPVQVPATIEEATEIALARPATWIELRYLVVGATDRSAPAPTGRATVSLKPALSSTFGDLRAVVEVTGTEVHNLVCVDRPPEEQLCGVDHGDGWRTQRLPADSSAVIALVDLPDPGS